MTRLEALRQAVQECRQRFSYVPDRPDDYWQTPEETEQLGTGDCEDFAVWAIHRTEELAPGSVLQLVIGETERGAHAWVELFDGRMWWADPTHGFPTQVESPLWWADRVPKFGYLWNGQEFGERFEYEKGR